MELTKQVPSLELCKRLKELGWTDSFFAWDKENGQDYLTYHIAKHQTPAPTVSELGEAIMVDGMGDYLIRNGVEHLTMYFLIELLTNPDKLAEMWIYLKENKLI